MAERFPPGLYRLLEKAGAEAWSRGERLYLVGGGVRDLLLGRLTLDLDLVVEGEAITLAESLAAHGGGAGIRDTGLLESAVAAPQASFGGMPLISDPVDISAAANPLRLIKAPDVDHLETLRSKLKWGQV